ncbi:ATP-dependent sacrificial sulfur transferase LarE [bacterium]|nr:ATP-dependent sacrificial sulfur transferase LarE [candidate division CSSED10-310 bacterium]
MIKTKYRHLLAALQQLQSVLVAFSGGVDSTLLLFAAREALGASAMAVTIRSPLVPEQEIEEACRLAQVMDARHLVLEVDQLADEGIRSNRADRCYLCKRMMFKRIQAEAGTLGCQHVLEGSNLDDLGDYRPGLTAVREQGILSPFIQAGMNKSDIRGLARIFDLPNWDRPAQACLASRLPYGHRITPGRLARIQRAEESMHRLGFKVCRVRVHGRLARLELPPDELPRALETSAREAIISALKRCGFSFVSLDLEGYRTGSMTATLIEARHPPDDFVRE